MKIQLLLRSLGVGGTERQVVLLANGLAARGHIVEVITLKSENSLLSDLDHSKVAHISLQKQTSWGVIKTIIGLSRCVKRFRPDVVYSFLPVQNILAASLKIFSRNFYLVWGCRAAFLDTSQYDWRTKIVIPLAAAMSNIPDAIIVNSREGMRYHLTIGYPKEKIRYVPNAVNVKKYTVDTDFRQRVRHELSIADNEFVVGWVGRLDPMKDLTTLLTAYALIKKKIPGCKFIIACAGTDSSLTELQHKISLQGLSDCVILIRNRTDMEAIYNSFDLLCHTSYGESMPNVILEAMAVGLPCVSTDVGDCREMIGEAGIVVPKRDPEAVAMAISKIHQLRPTKDYPLARVANTYTIEQLCLNTEKVFSTALARTVSKMSKK